MWGSMDEWGETVERTSAFSVAALAGAAILAASSKLTWISAQAGNGHVSYTLLKIPFLSFLFWVALAIIVVGAVAALAGRSRGLLLAGAAAAVVAGGAAMFVFFAESIAALIPGSGISLTFRQFMLAWGVGVGPGSWVALFAATAVAVATIPPARDWTVERVGDLWRRGRGALFALAALAIAIFALAQLRHASWVTAEALGSSLSLSPDALWGIAPGTLLAAWLVAVGLLLACFGVAQLGALLAAFAGWFVSFAAGLAIAVPTALSGTSLHSAQATGQAWLTFGLGLGIAAAAAALLRWGRALE